MGIELGWISQRGHHTPVNQDRVGWHIPRDALTWERKGALFVVADGMGGLAAGEVASQTAVQTVLYTYYADPTPHPPYSLRSAVETADRWVRYWAAVRPDLQGMGTTLTAVAVWNGQLVVAHVGDSRAYLVRERQAWLLTRDHTWVAEALAGGLLTTDEARRHPWRHVLTRSLGGSDAQVDVRRVVFAPGDRLVLLTDGVSDRLWDREIAYLAGRSPRRVARLLANLARQRGGDDDRTALVVGLGRAARQPRPVVGPAWQPVPVGATPASVGLAQPVGMSPLLWGMGLSAFGMGLLWLALLAGG